MSDEKTQKSHTKSKAGRKPELTSQLIKEVATVIRAGSYLEVAAAFCGVHRSTLHRWLKKGAIQKSGLYREFRDAVEKAMAHAEVRDVYLIDAVAHGKDAVLDEKTGKEIRPAIEPNWQAAAWRLERKYPKRWGRKTNIRIEDEESDQKPGAAFGDDTQSLNAVLVQEIERLEAELPPEEKQFED